MSIARRILAQRTLHVRVPCARAGKTGCLCFLHAGNLSAGPVPPSPAVRIAGISKLNRLEVAWTRTAAFVAVGLFSATMPARNSSTSNPPAGQAARSPDGQAVPTHRLDAATDTPGDVSDRRDLEGFFDGLCNVQMASKHIAGAVVAVVGNDRIVFAKAVRATPTPNRDAESTRRQRCSGSPRSPSCSPAPP